MEDRIRNLELEVLKIKTSQSFAGDSLSLHYSFIDLGVWGDGFRKVSVKFVPDNPGIPYVANLFSASQTYDSNPFGLLQDRYDNNEPVWTIKTSQWNDESVKSEKRLFYCLSTAPGKLVKL